jgi:hypothetical protein
MRTHHRSGARARHHRRQHALINVVRRKSDGFAGKVAEMFGLPPPWRDHVDQPLVREPLSHRAQGGRLIGVGRYNERYVVSILIGVIENGERKVYVRLLLPWSFPSVSATSLAFYGLLSRMSKARFNANVCKRRHIGFMTNLLPMVAWEISGAEHDLLDGFCMTARYQLAQSPKI